MEANPTDYRHDGETAAGGRWREWRGGRTAEEHNSSTPSLCLSSSFVLLLLITNLPLPPPSLFPSLERLSVCPLRTRGTESRKKRKEQKDRGGKKKEEGGGRRKERKCLEAAVEAVYD